MAAVDKRLRPTARCRFSPTASRREQLGAPPAAPVDRGPDTLFGGKQPILGGFAGLEPAYTRIVHTDGMLMCGEAGLLINHELSIGGGGCGLMSKVDMSGRTGVADDRLTFGYGGLRVRYHFMAMRVVNVALSATVGAGGFEIGPFSHDTNHD